MSKKLLFILLGSLILFNLIFLYADDPASWDLLDEDCSDISDWTDGDTMNGVSEVDPAGQFHLYNTAGGSPVDNSLATISRDIGSYSDTYTFDVKMICDTIGDIEVGNDYFNLDIRSDDARLNIRFMASGLFISDGTTFNEVGTDLVQEDVWQTWRFLVDITTPASATCDVYLKNGTGSWTLVGDDIDCSATGSFTDGTTIFRMYGWLEATSMHMDWVRVADGLYIPVDAIGDDSQVMLIN